MDLLFIARSKLRRRQFDECIEICTEILARQPLDQAAWMLKTRALTGKFWIDDSEMEEFSIADALLDDNATATAPRPGTSLKRPQTGAMSMSGPNAGVRPLSSAGRPVTGFVRPGTASRGTGGGIEGAFAGARPGTSRPMSSGGRFIRLGTQSLLSQGASFIDVDHLDLKKYARRPALAKALCDYLIYHEHNPRKALELASIATEKSDFKDWWWKARIGKCMYLLGLFREAEQQFQSALKDEDTVITTLELCKVFLKLDQPNTALEMYHKSMDKHPEDTHLMLGVARVYEALDDLDRAVSMYRQVLKLDASSVESISSIAAHAFYSDQPEVALRLYRRLLQMGLRTVEIWNNIGLCCFYSGQYDLTIHCFERALALADDQSMGDVWYNIGQVALALGDSNFAHQCFKIAISADSSHAESFNNLGVIDLHRGKTDNARSNFRTAISISQQLHEAYFNAAILAHRVGDFQESFTYVQRTLDCYPDHADAKELLGELKKHFTKL